MNLCNADEGFGNLLRTELYLGMVGFAAVVNKPIRNLPKSLVDFVEGGFGAEHPSNCHNLWRPVDSVLIGQLASHTYLSGEDYTTGSGINVSLGEANDPEEGAGRQDAGHRQERAPRKHTRKRFLANPCLSRLELCAQCMPDSRFTRDRDKSANVTKPINDFG